LCGKDAAEVLATLCTFLQALAYAGRSRWEVGYPGWTSLTVDERRILNLIAAAQSDDAKRFLKHTSALGIAAQALVTALNEHDLRLPLPRRSSLSAIAAKV
jgi:hypothetical protein